MSEDRAEDFGKWLTRKFLDLQSESGRVWTVTEFAKYLGCSQQSVSRWMSGGSLPESARAIDRLRDKFGAEVNTVLDIPLGGDGIEPRVYAKFLGGWNRLPPDLQKEVEDFFSTITPEELGDFIKDVIRIRRERGKQPAAGDAGESEPGAELPKPRKDSGRKKATLKPA